MLYGIQSVQFIQILICYTKVLVVTITYATRSALFKSIPNMLVGTYPTLTVQNTSTEYNKCNERATHTERISTCSGWILFVLFQHTVNLYATM